MGETIGNEGKKEWHLERLERFKELAHVGVGKSGIQGWPGRLEIFAGVDVMS